MAATASATEVRITLLRGSPRISPMMKTTATMPMASLATLLARPWSCFCNGVSPGSVSLSNVASRPIWVSIPVPVATNSPRPRVIALFMNTMPLRSPSGTDSSVGPPTALTTGVLSPVRADSAASRFAVEISRPSAGTRSPASSSTMSPGTTSRDSTYSSEPSRRTRAREVIEFRSASTDFSARCSCMKPITTLRTTTVRTIAGVLSSPDTSQATTAAVMRSRMSLSVKPASRRRHAGTPAAATSSFGPWESRRRAASCVESPSEASPLFGAVSAGMLEAAVLTRVPSVKRRCSFSEGLSRPS
ncbi:unannotated protein [freshwater metagenome]|uniref:Unannotated protein n=1 Tax=freshwater metagenome TaxID=449393 RepID=A0A6J6Z252_9ZZZZ